MRLEACSESKYLDDPDANEDPLLVLPDPAAADRSVAALIERAPPVAASASPCVVHL